MSPVTAKLLLRDHKKLVALMTWRGVGVRQLAGAAGYRSHTHVWRLCNGQAEGCEREYAERIARRLGVQTDELFVASTAKNFLPER